jgi:hypothetical protein
MDAAGKRAQVKRGYVEDRVESIDALAGKL